MRTKQKRIDPGSLRLCASLAAFFILTGALGCGRVRYRPGDVRADIGATDARAPLLDAADTGMDSPSFPTDMGFVSDLGAPPPDAANACLAPLDVVWSLATSVVVVIDTCTGVDVLPVQCAVSGERDVIIRVTGGPADRYLDPRVNAGGQVDWIRDPSRCVVEGLPCGAIFGTGPPNNVDRWFVVSRTGPCGPVSLGFDAANPP